MILKKLNAFFSWLLILSLMGHLGTMSYSMLAGWYDYTICKALAHTTAIIAVLHIALSLIIVFFNHDGSDLRTYKKQNTKTIMQRASGLVIIALLHVHVQSFGFIVTGEALSSGTKAEILITEILFFGAICMHLAVSFSKSLITFGIIRSEKAEKVSEYVMYVLCLAIFVLITWAILSFVLGWTGYAG